MKKIKILLIAIGILVIGIIVWSVLDKGTLTIKTSPVQTTVIVDGKNYLNAESITLKGVRSGRHTIIVKKELYQDVNEVVKLSFRQNKSIEISLDETKDGKDILTSSNKMTSAWVSYTKTKDANKLLSAIKPYLSQDVYESIETNLLLATEQTRPDIINIAPTIYAPLSKPVLSKTGDKTAIAVAGGTKTNDEGSLSNLTFEFEKIGDSWVIVDIEFNY